MFKVYFQGRNHGESSALLILTQTRTDGQGRRHSVAVGVININNSIPITPSHIVAVGAHF